MSEKGRQFKPPQFLKMKNKFFSRFGFVVLFAFVFLVPAIMHAGLVCGPSMCVDTYVNPTSVTLTPSGYDSNGLPVGFNPGTTNNIRNVTFNITGFWRGWTNTGTWVMASCNNSVIGLSDIYFNNSLNSVSINVPSSSVYLGSTVPPDMYIQNNCSTGVVDTVQTSTTFQPAPWQYWPPGYYGNPNNMGAQTNFTTGLYFSAFAHIENVSSGAYVSFVSGATADICANVSGNQTSVPADMYADGGNCYYYPPIVNITGPAELPLCGSGTVSWTSQYAQYWCSPASPGSGTISAPGTDGLTSSVSVWCVGYGGQTTGTHTVTARAALGNNCSYAPPQCSDGIDNDGNGLADHPSDSNCDDPSDDYEAPIPQCSDTVDNDGDGQTDYPSDIGCVDGNDNDETNVVVLPQCSDTVDNDGDGQTDYPNDTGCVNTLDTDETNPVIPPSPALSFTAADYTPTWGTATTLSWDAQNVTSCTASGDWSGSKALSGSESTGVMWWNKTFVLTCTGAYGSIAKTVSIGLSGTSACSDSIDNDGDGLLDFGGDPGCDDIMDDDETNVGADVCPNLAGSQSSVPSGYSLDGLGNCILTPTQCADAVDNDSDGFVDYPADLDCLSLSDIDESGPLGGGPQCSDGIDNDGDTLVDTNDPDCHTDGNPGNGGSYDPGDTNETNTLIPGFTLGSSEDIKIVFTTSGTADSEAKTVSVNPVGGFVGNVTLTLGAITPALPVGTTALYSFNGGAFSASPSITIPYNGSASLRVRISNKITSPYTFTLTGSSAGFADSVKQYTIVPTNLIPVFEEY